MIEVYVYPDGEQYVYQPTWKFDDFEVRKTELCTGCDRLLEVHYSEPLASCECGVQEWSK